MYKWEIKKVSPAELEDTLDKIPKPWEVFAILAYGSDFLVIVKRPK